MKTFDSIHKRTPGENIANNLMTMAAGIFNGEGYGENKKIEVKDTRITNEEYVNHDCKISRDSGCEICENWFLQNKS